MPRRSRSIAVGAAVAIALAMLGGSALYDMAREDARARIAALTAERQAATAQQVVEEEETVPVGTSSTDGSDNAAGDSVEPGREDATAPEPAARDRNDGQMSTGTSVEANLPSSAGEDGAGVTAPAEPPAQGEIPGETSTVAPAGEAAVSEPGTTDGAQREEEVSDPAGVQAEAQPAESAVQPDRAAEAGTPPEEAAVPSSAEETAPASAATGSDNTGADADTVVSAASEAQEPPAPARQEIEVPVPAAASPTGSAEDPLSPSTTAGSGEAAGDADPAPAPAPAADEPPVSAAEEAEVPMPAAETPLMPAAGPAPPSTMAGSGEAAGDADAAPAPAPAADEPPVSVTGEPDESAPEVAARPVPAEDPAPPSVPASSGDVAADAAPVPAPARAAEETSAPIGEEVPDEAAPPMATPSVPAEDPAPPTAMAQAETAIPPADAATTSAPELQEAGAAAAESDGAFASPTEMTLPLAPAAAPTPPAVMTDRERPQVRAESADPSDPSEPVPPAAPAGAGSVESRRGVSSGDPDEVVGAEAPALASGEGTLGDSANGTDSAAPAPPEESAGQTAGVEPDDRAPSVPAEAQQMAALPETAVDDQAPDQVPAAVPEEIPSPDPATPSAPEDVAQFDVVQVSPDGTVVVAGRTRPGSRVEFVIDGDVITSDDTNRNGEFVFVPDVQLRPGVRELSVAVRPPDAPDRRLASRIVVVLIPDREMLAARATEPAESVPSDAPIALLVDEQGETVGVIQPSPEMTGSDTVLSLATVTFDQKGYASITGGGDAGRRITVYLDNEAIGSVLIGEDGFWTVRTERRLAKTGTYKLRIDQTGANDDAVTERIVTTLIRAGGKLIPAAATVVTVEKGMTLWGISRRHYGRGILYTLIYSSNSYQIADPHWIYPGQKFLIPDRQ